MALTDLWAKSHEAICSLTFLRQGARISSGSGFKVGRYLVTNNHVVQVPTADGVHLRFVASDGHTTRAELTLVPEQLTAILRDGQPEQQWDFAILDLGGTPLAGIPTLDVSRAPDLAVGRSIALLGYHFDQDNLAIHSGIISSRYDRAGVEYLQLDASVNQGNSGGPLLDPDSGEVIGIVTRKATGLSRQFDELIASFEGNLAALQGAQAVMRIGGVDPVEAFAITQRQMGQVAQEIRRSANVGIGYAYTLREIARSLGLLDGAA